MKTTMSISALVIASLSLGACGGGSSASNSAAPPAQAKATISGTVPGTKIEAFSDNGAYSVTQSVQNGTAQHPFTLEVPAGVGLHLVMTMNEGTANSVVAPIAFTDATGAVRTRLVPGANDAIDVKQVGLPLTRAEAAGGVDDAGQTLVDADGDGVLDQPFQLLDSNSPLHGADADNDGVDDYTDSDHGGRDYSNTQVDPMDVDGDGIPNQIDPAFVASAGDTDSDGLIDKIDANPDNTLGNNSTFIDDRNNDGYHDDDKNHDGFHDDDSNRNGFHDDDSNQDGFHDDDSNQDGFHDGDTNEDGVVDSNDS